MSDESGSVGWWGLKSDHPRARTGEGLQPRRQGMWATPLRNSAAKGGNAWVEAERGEEGRGRGLLV